MRPTWDYLLLSIETLVNSISLLIMIPCFATHLRTKGLHGNCKILLITSATLQVFLLYVQTALFVYNYVIGNLDHSSPTHTICSEGDAIRVVPELVVRHVELTTFGASYRTEFSLFSLFYISQMSRTFAVHYAARYEQTRCHLFPLFAAIGISFAVALFIVYANYWIHAMFTSVIVLYAIEGCTLAISLFVIIFARRKYRVIPYDCCRLKAKYQIKEVLDFSMAILPSVILGAVMHTLSLVPTILWIHCVISYPICCVIYYSVQSLNCILTKIALIGCHKEMRQRFQRILFSNSGPPKGSPIVRNFEKEGKEYFEQMKAQWDIALQKENNTGRNGRA